MKIFPKQPQSITAELLSLQATLILRTKLLLNTSFGNQKPLDKSFLLLLEWLLLPATSRKLLNIPWLNLWGSIERHMHQIWGLKLLIFTFNPNRLNSILKNEYSARFFSCEVMSFPRLQFMCGSLNANASCHNSRMNWSVPGEGWRPSSKHSWSPPLSLPRCGIGLTEREEVVSRMDPALWWLQPK